MTCAADALVAQWSAPVVANGIRRTGACRMARQLPQYAVGVHRKERAWSRLILLRLWWSAPGFRPRGDIAAVLLDAEAAHDIDMPACSPRTRDAGLIYLQPEQPDRHLTSTSRSSGDRTRNRAQRVLVDEAYIHFSDAPSVAGLAVQCQERAGPAHRNSTGWPAPGSPGHRIRSAGHGRAWPLAATTWCPRRPPTPAAESSAVTIWCHGAQNWRSASAPSPGCASRAWLHPALSQSNCLRICAVPPSWSSPNWRNSGDVERSGPSWPNRGSADGRREEMQAFRSAFASVSWRRCWCYRGTNF